MMWKDRLPGLILVSLITLLAFMLYPLIPGANEILLGLLFGVLLGNATRLHERFSAGVTYLSKDGLNVSIIFLGFGISFYQIGAVGWQMVALLTLLVGLMLVLTFTLARIFRCRTSTGWLVGFGTAICGSSAIAALAGSVQKEKEDAGIAIAVVNLLGLGGMLLLPMILAMVPMSEVLQATLLGGTLHAVGNVAGAGYAMGDSVGDLALTIKLGRVALLAPGLLFFNWMVHRAAPGTHYLSLPYYIWGFILAVSVVTFLPLPGEVVGGLKWIGKVLLALAMAAIGLKISVRQLFYTGRIAMGFGVIIFVVQVLVVLGLAWLLI
jgi:uncharacterized integral membrane protein (TIGR00698 family)